MYSFIKHGVQIRSYSLFSRCVKSSIVITSNKNISSPCVKPRFSSVCISCGKGVNGNFQFVLMKLANAYFRSRFYTTDSESDESDDELENMEYEKLVKHTLKIPETGHQVLVIQPYIKWGQSKRTNTTPQLQLDEAVALIKTLPNWKVVNSMAISLMNFHKTKIFGKGNLEYLTELITNNGNITAVFISINMMSPLQQSELEETFKVPVFDRYSIVVQIFKLHAVTQEAKIQVAMGEIPYLWSRLRFDRDEVSDKMGGGATVGGPGETWLEIKRRLLQDKERKLKMQLKKLKLQRDIVRKKRVKLELPVIAVVGYTNAGKTSLIKALTKEDSLKPKDVLFATLDVTVHAGYLPSGLKVLFVDTVGFLSDIPTNLIQSFIATLEDAVQADLIIHVQDISHPDLKAQHEHVISTLQSLKLPQHLLEKTITVGNKVDKVTGSVPDLGTSSFPVSCTLNTGLNDLKLKLEDGIIKATGQMFIRIRVPNGGPEYFWLHREATVVKATADEKDSQFAILNTIITETNLNRFKYKFISSPINRRNG